MFLIYLVKETYLSLFKLEFSRLNFMKDNFENRYVHFDKERTKLVFSKLLEAYHNKVGIFSQSPESLCPSYNLPNSLDCKKDHSLFYFYSVLGDARVKSSVNYNKFKKLYERDKRYFNPEFLAEQNLPETNYELVEEGTLEYILGMEIGNPTPVNLARSIIMDSRILLEKYEGNPLKIFSGIDDVLKAHEKIKKEFRGYGPNLSSLLLTFYLKHKLVSFSNENALPPKVDFHDITLMFAFGVMKSKFKDMEFGIKRYNIDKLLQGFLSYVALENGYNIIELDNALWFLGSQVCTKFDWLECWNNCGVKEYCHTKPGSDLKKVKKNNIIIDKDYHIYPLIEARIKNIGDLSDLFIPNFQDRTLL